VTKDVYRFGDFELDRALFQLRGAGRVLKIEPKVFDVLLHLIERRERVVTKDELLDALWPNESVSESVLPRCIAAVRRVLGRGAIQTAHGRGYRFVLAVAEDPSSTDSSASGDGADPVPPTGVFVGREAAMTVLRAALADALAGRGRLVLLSGEPGIGKTRTADELAAEARARGAPVVTGRCHEGEGAPAFWPWVQVLRAQLARRGARAFAADLGTAAGEVAELLPELREQMPDMGAPPALAGEQARFRLFDGVASYLKRASDAEPTVLVLDDLHWADKPSLLLLQFLAREMAESRLLVVGTYRDVALSRRHALAGVLGELAREALYERVALRGLDRAAVGRFLEHATGAAAAPGLVAAVYEMTEGNPFFMGETVRLLIADGRLDETRAGGLPEGVREAIGRRLGVLSDECNRVLAVASVAGREFALPVLARTSGAVPERLLELLAEAVAARLLGEVPGRAGMYRFPHALVRETLYEELGMPERVRLHVRVGEVLEEMHRANPGPVLAELAHHFYQGATAGGADRAVAYGTLAADRALHLLAYEESALHYERVLQVMELDSTVDEAARCGVLLKLGEAESRAGERESARGTFQRAADGARALGRPDLLARAALGFGGRAEFGVPYDAPLLALLEEALRSLGPSDDGLRARLLGRLVGTSPHSDSMETRDRLSAEAVALARATGDPATLAEALTARHWALLGPDHVAERRAIGAELRGLAQRLGDRTMEFAARNCEFDALLELGEVAAADRELDLLEALARELRQPIEQWFVAWFRAGRHLADGRFDDAERAIEAGRAIGRRAQHPSAETTFGGQLLWLRGERGEVTSERLDEFAAGYEFITRSVPSARSILRAGRAVVLADAGRTEEARAELDAMAAHGFTDLPRDEHWMITLMSLADLVALLEDGERAQHLYDLLLPFADRNGVHSLIRASRGSVSHALGRLAAARRDRPTAERHFRDAIAMNRRMGARAMVARSECEYAGVLLDHGRAADRRRARELLASAEGVANELGVEWLRRRIAGFQGRLERSS
jgi:DNA-binding winged helix-turn-helix (wHTH) protein/tetratricopeptide (TPR) repeat protein